MILFERHVQASTRWEAWAGEGRSSCAAVNAESPHACLYWELVLQCKDRFIQRGKWLRVGVLGSDRPHPRWVMLAPPSPCTVVFARLNRRNYGSSDYFYYDGVMMIMMS